ncbi:MAG: cation:proton antiporter [Bacteroidales bacterium]|nr:cation:proton antiporter [Bacteroidales bacterium]
MFLKIDLTLPLTNPVLIFTLILFIILFSPLLLNKLKIPAIIGFILAGIIISPYGLNLMVRDSSIILFGTIGFLYLMFLAGLEIDLLDFKKNSTKSIVFGMYTFFIPMITGTLISLYFLGFSIITSVLLASMFASHTLITYPIVSKLGVTKNKAVNIAIGGTMITDTLALLVLAVIAGMSEGELTSGFWMRLSFSIIIFVCIVVFIFPIIGRWFFKHYKDNISQFIFVLGMVFLGAFLAQVAGIESIIGAFLTGLSLNRLIPRTSPLMNRIEFVGNALFIPFFLIGIGMLIDYKAFFKNFETIKVAVTMTVIATASKFIAAWFTQKTFRFTTDQRRLIFGLSNAQAAATLAAVLIGYNIILGHTESGEPIRLLNDAVLNGTILMIMVTCIIASYVTQKGAQNIVDSGTEETHEKKSGPEERILIPVNNPETLEELVNLSIIIKSKINNTGLYALNVIESKNTDEKAAYEAGKLLRIATVTAAATDNQLHELLRYDLDIVNGILSEVKEFNITDLVIGLHQKTDITDSFLGNLTECLLNKCNITTLIYKPVQPFSTLGRHLIIMPYAAEKETGFPYWLIKIWNIAWNTGNKLVFYATVETLKYLRKVNISYPIDAEFIEFENWDNISTVSQKTKNNDNLIFILSRAGYPSYNFHMANISALIKTWFKSNNLLLIYPLQHTAPANRNNNGDSTAESVIIDASNTQDETEKTIIRLFRSK